MFNAPLFITNIPDIAQIYYANEKQSEDLDKGLAQIEKNIYLETMDVEMVGRWEKILGIVPSITDTVSDRIFRVKARVLESIPYSERVILKRLQTLCPEGYIWKVSEDRLNVTVKLALSTKNKKAQIEELLDRILPLNMTYSVDVLYNSYGTLKQKKYSDMRKMSYTELRENVLE